MPSKRSIYNYLCEGTEWFEIYNKYPDINFLPKLLIPNDIGSLIFCGRASLSDWLEIRIPLPSIPLTFWGSPVQDFFPDNDTTDVLILKRRLEAVLNYGREHQSWGIIVKDLIYNHPIEPILLDHNFVPLEDEPIYLIELPSDINIYMNRLSPGRRRGLKGHLNKFEKNVLVRKAGSADAEFIYKSYQNVLHKAEVKLEKLTKDFFIQTIDHPSSIVLIYEYNDQPFAFVLLWKNNDVLFFKYAGMDNDISRKMSFYSVNLFHTIRFAIEQGFRWYVAGQWAGKEKNSMKLRPEPVRLWIKPLKYEWLTGYFIKRFSSVYSRKVNLT